MRASTTVPRAGRGDPDIRAIRVANEGEGRDIKRKHSDRREDKYIFVRDVEQTEDNVIMGPSEHN